MRAKLEASGGVYGVCLAISSRRSWCSVHLLPLIISSDLSLFNLKLISSPGETDVHNLGERRTSIKQSNLGMSHRENTATVICFGKCLSQLYCRVIRRLSSTRVFLFSRPLLSSGGSCCKTELLLCSVFQIHTDFTLLSCVRSPHKRWKKVQLRF